MAVERTRHYTRRMPHPALLFDLDGTLVDTLTDICATANAVRVSFGLPEAPLSTARRWVGHGAHWLLERALAENEPDQAMLDAAWARYREHHRDQCTRNATPYPGTREALTEWRAAGHPLGVVTNKPTEFAERVLNHAGVAEFFAVVIAGDTLPTRKPDPEPLHEALRRLGSTGPAWMIGDSEPDIRAGKAAKIQTVACLFGFRGEAIRAERADAHWTAFGQPEHGAPIRW